jgi:hypothetical protein
VSRPPLNNPNARYWDDLVEDFGFTPEEQDAVRSDADRMVAEVRAQRLAEVRKRQNATQMTVAAAMGESKHSHVWGGARTMRVVAFGPAGASE